MLLVVICQYLQRLHQERTGHKRCEPIYKEKRYDFVIKPSDKNAHMENKHKIYVSYQITTAKILWPGLKNSDIQLENIKHI